MNRNERSNNKCMNMINLKRNNNKYINESSAGDLIGNDLISYIYYDSQSSQQTYNITNAFG